MTTKYVYDSGQVIAEYDGSNNPLRKFVYGPGIDEPIIIIDVADNNAVYYYHFDGLGSVAALSDANGAVVEKYEYDVFGGTTIKDASDNVLTESAIGNPYGFTSRRLDTETDNYYYRARYYNPEIGRFLQTDPIGYAGGLNLYSYCGNNPLNWVDPFGLCKEEKSWWDKMWEEAWIMPWQILDKAWALEREYFPNRLDVGQGDYRHFIAGGSLNRHMGPLISLIPLIAETIREEDPLDARANWRGWWHSTWHPFTPLQDLAKEYITRLDSDQLHLKNIILSVQVQISCI